MLPAYIIEQIRQRDAERRYQQKELVLELPLPPPDYVWPTHTEEKEERGVVIIELLSK